MRTATLLFVAVLLTVIAVPPSAAAEADATGGPATERGSAFGEASVSAENDLAQALAELSALRKTIAEEKLPLSRELNRLERRLTELRSEFDGLSRKLDTQNLELNTQQTEMDARREETAYLANLLDEYVRNLETRVHITELQRYREQLEQARMAPEDEELGIEEVFLAQTATVEASLDRLTELIGGTTFEGSAVGQDGMVRPVRFALIGPVALYSALEGADAGLAEQRIGSLEPNMVLFDDPESLAAAKALVDSGKGRLPFDPSLGNARRIEATQDSVWEHVSKGGPVMVPILLLAGSALIVALIKWIQLIRVRQPSERSVGRLLEQLKSGDAKSAAASAERIPGPTGEMLRVGLEQIRESKDLVEEMMYEKTLETRLRLQRFLSFVAIAAAAAPLLGLLGTVTGIINTFKLITVFGTGDAKTLSSGISEALITTEFGLIVAIPSLFLHAYLSRKVRRMIDGMEKTAVKFLNRISPAGEARDPEGGRRSAAADKTRESRASMPPLAVGTPVPVAEGSDH
jgi:biopolymer transport protein ExbB